MKTEKVFKFYCAVACHCFGSVEPKQWSEGVAWEGPGSYIYITFSLQELIKEYIQIM